jgi:hypothetical protein
MPTPTPEIIRLTLHNYVEQLDLSNPERYPFLFYGVDLEGNELKLFQGDTFSLFSATHRIMDVALELVPKEEG